MWQNPHILILDEPTNYLDREGLGALVLAIKDYKGGVLIISHNKEFCDGVATEKWIMQGAASASKVSPWTLTKRRLMATRGPMKCTMALATRSLSTRLQICRTRTGRRRSRISRRKSRT